MNILLRWALIVLFVAPTMGAVVLVVGYLAYGSGPEAGENLSTTVLLSLLMLDVLLVLGLVIVNRLTTSLEQLNWVSRKLAAGHLDQRLPTDSSIYELNALAQTFNQMADQLQHCFNSIQTRKAAELDLQKSEVRYRAIVEDQTELITRALPDTTLTFVNDAFCRFHDVQPEEVLGKAFLSLIYPEDRDRIAQRLQSLTPDHPTCTTENRGVLRNGEVRWMQWSDRLLFDEQGNITEIQSVGRDITALKQTEEALRQSEATLLQAQRIAHLGSWELDLATQQLTGSEEMFRIAGIDPTHPGSSLPELQQMGLFEASEELELAIEQAIAHGTPYEVEHSIRRLDGTLRYVISKGQVLRNEQEQVVRLYGTVLDITERKLIEVALQASEARFRELAETMREGFFVFETATSQYSYLNPACIVITGVPTPASTDEQSYTRGMAHWFNNIHPDDRDRIQKALQQEQQGQAFDQEYRFIRPDGEVRWLRSKAYPIQNEIGEVVRIVGTVEDIHERKQAEAEIQRLNRELTERVNELQTLFEVLPIGVAIGEDPECRFARVNPCLSELLHVPLDQNASPGAPEGDRPAYRPCRNGEEITTENLPMQYAAMHNTDVRDEVLDIVHPDGTLIKLLSYASPLHDAEGNVRGVIGGFVDITDRVKTEEALRQSEERFRKAFDDAPIGISLISPTGQFLKTNTFYCQLLGYTEAELLNMAFQDITYPADLEADLEVMGQLLAGKISTLQIEKRYITKQGSVIPVQVNAAPIRDQDGELLYIVGHIQDLRDRYRVERMKNEFISVISHELRTPLTSIRGALGLLVSGTYTDRPEKVQHMLNIAASNSERLVRLVNDILDLERLESGKVKLIKQPYPIRELLQQAIDSVQAIADQSAIHLALTAPDVTAWVASDAIVQTLTNLLSNAIKFSPAGSTVWVKAVEVGELEEGSQIPDFSGWKQTLSQPQQKSGIFEGYILFSITDRGRGIPADKLDVIFERFQQADVSDSRRKEGTGLGLAICQSIVQQHGGKIWVESVLGEGSTFYFTVPMLKEDGHDQAYSDRG